MRRVRRPKSSRNLPCKTLVEFNPKIVLTVKKDSGRKMIVTTVKTRMALLLDSAMIASSFCSIVRSWKSCSRGSEDGLCELDLRCLPRLVRISSR